MRPLIEVYINLYVSPGWRGNREFRGRGRGRGREFDQGFDTRASSFDKPYDKETALATAQEIDGKDCLDNTLYSYDIRLFYRKVANYLRKKPTLVEDYGLPFKIK